MLLGSFLVNLVIVSTIAVHALKSASDLFDMGGGCQVEHSSGPGMPLSSLSLLTQGWLGLICGGVDMLNLFDKWRNVDERSRQTCPL